ncbi:MAG: peroxiredoxin family protein [Candidatus Wenzhouxiangella sp. M2_3B_020]
MNAPSFIRIIVISLAIATMSAGTAALAAEEEARQAESFTLEDAGGEAITLPDEQQGVGLYLFWATWCPYCKALMPHLQSIEDEFGDRVTVYALNFRDKADPRGYIDEHGFDFVLLPDAGEVAGQWGAHVTPALYIVDQEGTVRFDLYEVLTEDPPGYADLGHTQRAARRAPFWAARIRASLDEVLAESD